MQNYQFDDMDEMVENNGMGNGEDMHEEFYGGALGNSDSDGEDYDPLVCCVYCCTLSYL